MLFLCPSLCSKPYPNLQWQQKLYYAEKLRPLSWSQGQVALYSHQIISLLNINEVLSYFSHINSSTFEKKYIEVLCSTTWIITFHDNKTLSNLIGNRTKHRRKWCLLIVNSITFTLQFPFQNQKYFL